MPVIPGRAWAFIWAIVSAGVAVVVWLFPNQSLTTLQEMGTVFLLGALLFTSGFFPIHINKTKFLMTTAAEFACILILSPAWATWTVAAATFLFLSAQHNSRLKNPWAVTLFNTAGIALPTAAAALLYRSLVGTDQFFLTSWSSLLAVSLAGLVFFVTNTGIHTVFQSLMEKKPVLHLWLITYQGILLHWALLGLLGVMTTILHHTLWWSMILLAIPTAAVYQSAKKVTRTLKLQTKESVQVLADLVDMRDPYTFGHSQRVALTSIELARRLGLPEEEMETIYTAARVHDIGKIILDPSILRKPGKLTEEDWIEIRKHPKVGADILAPFPELEAGREIVLQHHERYDGRGYPNGNKGETIPLGARILAVADSLDAMTSDRPYRKALPIDVVMGEFERNAGIQWDPKVTSTLLAILNKHSEKERAVVPLGLGSLAFEVPSAGQAKQA
ncbi:MAG: HD-GYP domain-containing protein [Chloroflexi bacterium]|nr:HD-GYP domain-containing protein [Chloroflexota bacterium]